MNIGTWLYKRSIFSPHKTAILYENQTLSYLEMNRRVNRLCSALVQMGFETGDRIGVMSRNCPEFLEVYFACAKTGFIFVPLNFRLAPPEIAHQIDDSGLKLLFFDEVLAETIRKTRPLITAKAPVFIHMGPGPDDVFQKYEKVLKGRDESEPPIPADQVTMDSDQMIMYTSGTTGSPKGALLSHKKTLYNTLNAQVFFDLYSQDIMLIVLPLFHSGGLNIMAVPTLYAGGTLILCAHFDPDQFLRLIEEHRVTQAMLVPTMVNTLLKETRPETFDLSSIRSILIGGEPASAELVREAQKKGLPVRQIFGQTETSIELWVPEEMSWEKAGAVGLPVFHGDVHVVDKENRPVEPGEIGEIVVNGPIIMTAYWNMPEETRATVRDGWLHTRDLGRRDEDGYVYAVDRMGDMYISGGENVYPAEIEKVLLNHPKVFEAAIIGIPHEKWGYAGHAFIRPKQGQSISHQEIVSFLRDRVAAYKIPGTVEQVDEIPKTASGKIKKSELAKAYSKKNGTS